MRAVVGVTVPDAGEVRWRGAPVDAAARRAFGYMPEERGLYPGMIVLEQLVYLGRLYGLTKAEARSSALEWTGRLGIADKRDLKIETLSQGNQQRVQLAAALVHGPELLVLDEPFSGLDPVGVDAMSAVLAERAAAGATVLFSSHQLDLVQDICEAVAIIHRGRLVAQGRLADLREAASRVSRCASPGTRRAGGRPGSPPRRESQTSPRAPCPWRSHPARTPSRCSTGRGGRPGGALRLRGPAPLGGVPRGRRRRRGRGGPGGAGGTGSGRQRRRASMNSWLGTVWLIAGRELRQGARAKSFRIVTMLLVAAVAAAMLIPAALHDHQNSTPKVGIVGAGPAAVLTIRTAARITGTAAQPVTFASLGEAEAALRDGNGGGRAGARTRGADPRTPYAGIPTSGSSLEGALALAGGLIDSGGRDGAHAFTQPPIRGLAPPLTGLSVRLTGLAVSIVIYMIIVIYGVRITIGVSEEKSSRVVEVLLAAVRPSQLLLGKVLGLGLLALGQALAIVLTFVILGVAVGSSLIHSASLEVVAVGAVWIVIGYAFYCTAYAAAGSLVTKPSDASNASAPVQLPLIASYILTFTVLYGDSVYGFYWFLAYFPPTAPVSMTVLVALGVAQPWQVALSMLICVASTVLMAWVAARIYGRAILHTGSRMKWRQAWRREA